MLINLYRLTVSLKRKYLYHKVSNGFTLVEILVAISIIGLISVVAIPNYRQFLQDQNIYTDSGNIAETLKQAQSNALNTINQCNPPTTPAVEQLWGLKFTATNKYYLYTLCGSSLTDTSPTQLQAASTQTLLGTETVTFTPDPQSLVSSSLSKTCSFTSPDVPDFRFTISNGQPSVLLKCTYDTGTSYLPLSDFGLTQYKIKLATTSQTQYVYIDSGGNISLSNN